MDTVDSRMAPHQPEAAAAVRRSRLDHPVVQLDRVEPDEIRPTCGQPPEAYCFFSSLSPFMASLKLRIPAPKPLASSGIFLPPNSISATMAHRTISCVPKLPMKAKTMSVVPMRSPLDSIVQETAEIGATQQGCAQFTRRHNKLKTKAKFHPAQ